MGLNMPARTVLFTGAQKFDGKNMRWVKNVPEKVVVHLIRGVAHMTSAKFLDFLTLFPPITYRNQLILFLLSAFWIPPPLPRSADVISACARSTYVFASHILYS